jgi:iron complex outermembrane receptor protein
MVAFTKLNLLAGAAIAALAAPMSSHAADTSPGASADNSTIREVVVTANKREENLRNVAQSVTAISGETLDLQQAFHFEDYVTRIPGFNLVSSQAGESRLVLDGINAGGVSATIGTYVDETPYGSVTGLANGAVLAPDLDTFDIRRIEVLRGPQGTLYGASSLGGLLKLVTNAPDPSHYAAKIEVGGEDTDSSSTSGSVKALVNVPIGDNAAIRASGFYTDQAGFIDDPVRGAKNVDGTIYSGGRFGFFYHPIDKLTVRLSAVGQDILSKGSSTEDLNPQTLQPLYGDLTQSRTFSSPNKVAYRIYSMTANYDFGFANLLSATSYGTLRQDTNEDATAMYGALLTPIFGEPLGAGLLQNLEQKKFTQEVRLTSPPQALEWLVGGFFTRERNVLNQSLNGLSLPSAQVAPGLGGLETIALGSVYSEYAGFANVDYHFTDRLDLSLGGRYSHNDQSSGQVTAGPLAGGASTVSGTSSEGVFTFAVAPKYKINDAMTVYARISKGYRPGGPNALSPLAPAAVPRTFQSDSIIDYQAGFKADLFERRVSVDVSAFYIDWSHIQLLADVNGFGVNSNGGGAVSKGIEGTVSYVPLPGLNLSANGAYTQANLTSDTGPLLGGHSGDRLPYSSPLAGSLNADYDRSVSDTVRLFVGGSVRFVGRRRSDFDPNIGQLSLPSYTSLDLRGGVEWRNYRLEAYVKNVNDEHGILSVSGFGSTPQGAVQAGIMRPRTFGLALTAAY